MRAADMQMTEHAVMSSAAYKRTRVEAACQHGLSLPTSIRAPDCSGKDMKPIVASQIQWPRH